MSFSSQVKAELCRGEISRRCCAVAESCGILLYANSFTMSEARIVTESAEFASRLPSLFQEAFSVGFDLLPEAESDGKKIFRILSGEKLAAIWHTLGYDRSQHFALHLNFALLEEEHCRSAFLRGAFLAGGSVTDPQKRYHLELSTPHLQVAGETEALLRDMSLEPKRIMRKSNAVLYFKSSSGIEDLLTLMGAGECAASFRSAKKAKQVRNVANRRVNCDEANLNKAVDASRAQVAALTRLTESGIISTLPVGLQEVAVARLLQPELTLSELAASFDPPLTKSCLNHRMRKLMQLAQE